MVQFGIFLLSAVFVLFFGNWIYWSGVEKSNRKGYRKALKWVLGQGKKDTCKRNMEMEDIILEELIK